jgi:PleD family two-component response regulator
MRKSPFIKLIRFWGVVFLLALAGVIVGIDIGTTYHDFNTRVDNMRTDYVEQQKRMSKREVERVVDMINKDMVSKDKFILLVEDNPDDVDLTIRALKKANILNEIRVAEDGAEALEILLGTSSPETLPSVVLLDLKLPKVAAWKC